MYYWISIRGQVDSFKACSENCKKLLLTFSCRSVRLSVSMEQLGSHWTDFDETSYMCFFDNVSRKLKFH